MQHRLKICRSWRLYAGTAACAFAILMGSQALTLPAQAATTGADDQLRAQMKELKQQLAAQRRQIEAQQQRIDALEGTTGKLRDMTLGLYGSLGADPNAPHAATAATFGAGSDGYRFVNGAVQPATYRQQTQAAQTGGGTGGGAGGDTGAQPVGEAPKAERTRPNVPVLASEGGVLTPQGTLVLEPSLEISHTSANRFSFQGFQLAEVVLIGQIEASNADRDTAIPALTARYGITDRLEAEVKVPYVLRSDSVTNTIVAATPAVSTTTHATANDIGDIEAALHYQLNDGRGGWPYFVANVRAKSTTGKGPFDVSRDANGIETELSTGSGFWGVEPSLTVLYPTDPAVFFGSIGYVWNISSNVDTTIGGSHIGTVDPGDAVRGSFGMGYAINENSSFSIGYKHDYIARTTTEIDGIDRKSASLQSGSLFFGLSQKINDSVAVNLTVEGGVTADAPDASVIVRVPVALGLF